MKKIYFVVLAIHFCFACSMPLLKNNSCNANEYGVDYDGYVPYAGTEELNTIARNSEFVDWKISRIFAVIEKESIKMNECWSNASVSTQPIIIYDNNLIPKYYEFRILKDGNSIGAITCNARKIAGEPIGFVLDFAPKYEVKGGKKSGQVDEYVVDSGYPSKTAIVCKSKKDTDGLAEESVEFEVSVVEFLDNADTEVLAKLGITTEEMKQELLRNALVKQQQYSEMWRAIESNRSLILATTDQEIAEMYSKNSRKSVSSRGDWTSTFFAVPWYNKKDWVNPGGWCGPSCLAFISIGADCFPGVTWLPVNDFRTMYAVRISFEKEVGEGPRIWEELAPALEKFTPYKLDLGQIGAKLHDWGKVNTKMREYNTPAISLRTWAKRNGIWTWEWHYRVIIGTQQVHREWMEQFLWWKILKQSDSYYYYMHDNGSDASVMGGTSNWWETAGSLAQFQSVAIKAK